MKLYDKIKDLLVNEPILRNSDKKLQWRIWEGQGVVINNRLYFSDFEKAISPETIRRTRQKVQQDHPELQSTESVKKAKKKIQDTKGTFVYREVFTGTLF